MLFVLLRSRGTNVLALEVEDSRGDPPCVFATQDDLAVMMMEEVEQSSASTR